MALSSHMYVCIMHGYTHSNTGNVSSKALWKYFKCFYLCVCVCHVNANISEGQNGASEP